MSATSLSPAPTVPLPGRTAVIVGSVVLLHAVALWALQRGLVRPPAEVIVPAQILAELIAPPPPAAPPAPTPPPPAPPAPASPPPPKPRPAPPPPKPRAAPPRPAPVAQPRPAAPVVAPAPTAPAPVPAAPEPAPSPVAAAAPAAPAPSPPAPPAPPAPPVVVQPSTNAAYLNTSNIGYPPMSKRLGETGRVVVRVLIGPDGRAQDARLQRSSGFDRLDDWALQAARDRIRYVPGTRNGVPEAMWFNVPLNFVLE